MKFRVFVIVWSLLALSCKKKDKKDTPQPHEEHGAVTTVRLELYAPSDTVRAFYKDPDGPGGRSPEIDTLRPKAGSTYALKVFLLDESKNPPTDLTEEIFVEEATMHRLFIMSEPAELATLSVRDQDANGQPIGGVWTYQASDTVLSGHLHITLKHYLNEADKPRGLEAGSTDLDVYLPVKARP